MSNDDQKQITQEPRDGEESTQPEAAENTSEAESSDQQEDNTTPNPEEQAQETPQDQPETETAENTQDQPQEEAPSNPDESEEPANGSEEESPADLAEDEENDNEETTPQDLPQEAEEAQDISSTDVPGAKWYVIHTYSGHENRVANALKQRIESEHLENKILDILVPTQEKIEIRGGKKEQVKEKIFPGYLMVKMVLDDNSWLAVRTTPGVTSFVGIGNKPTPIPEAEVKSIVTFMTQGAAPTFKDVFLPDDTVKIVDGPFADFIGKVDTVDKEKGKVRVLVSIFGRETPVELDFLQVTKL